MESLHPEALIEENNKVSIISRPPTYMLWGPQKEIKEKMGLKRILTQIFPIDIFRYQPK